MPRKKHQAETETNDNDDEKRRNSWITNLVEIDSDDEIDRDVPVIKQDLEATKNKEGDNTAADQSEGGLSPPTTTTLLQPTLRRGQVITSRSTTQPGAVHVQGPGMSSQPVHRQQQQLTTLTATINDDETPLVNAELVATYDNEEGYQQQQQQQQRQQHQQLQTRHVVVGDVPHIPAEIFQATPIIHQDTIHDDEKRKDERSSSSQPKLSELLQNNTVRVVLVLFSIIILGLIIGLVAGLGKSSKPIVIEQILGAGQEGESGSSLEDDD